jgi:hypothetical protein
MAAAPKPKTKVKPRPEGVYPIPGKDSNVMYKRSKPKSLIVPGKSKSQAEIDKIFPRTAVKKTSRGPVTGTGTSSGTTTKKTPNLPKSTKMSESAKKIKITGSATGTKTPKPTNLKNYQKFGMTSKKSK